MLTYLHVINKTDAHMQNYNKLALLVIKNFTMYLLNPINTGSIILHFPLCDSIVSKDSSFVVILMCIN